MGRIMTQPPFFEELRAEQDRLRTQAGYLQRARSRRGALVRPRRVAARRAARWAFAASLGVAAAAAVTVTWQRWPAGVEPLSLTIGERGERGTAGVFVAAPADRELPLRFGDGTRFELAAGTSARVASLDERGAHLIIEKGRALAAVVHRPDSRWRLDVGPFQVAVVGTRFDVSWDAAGRVLDLRLDEGAVQVSGGLLREALEVRAGQRLRAFADDARVELSGGPLKDEPSAALDVVVGESKRAPEETPVASAPRGSSTAAAASAAAAPSWPALATAGKFREALAAAEKAGFEAECRRASGADLLALGDAARLSGAASRAEQAYTAARGKLPGGGRASYGLGLLAFDQRGDFIGAARHFEAYLREQPNGPLRAEATGRLMEAWQRAGRLNEARRVAEQYLSRYPQGPQASRAKQLLQ
jgi:TolA-binding protein